MVAPMNSKSQTPRTVVPAVLVYVERDQKLLMLYRNAKENDYHEGKWNGLGGKCELDESPLETAKRELYEESGLDLSESAFKALGTLTFPNFKAHKAEDWIVYVFKANPLGQSPWPKGPEGELVWVDKDKVLALNLWQGDKYFMPYVLNDTPFMGTIWYEGQNVTRSWMTKL